MVRPETEVWKQERRRAAKKPGGVAGQPDRQASWRKVLIKCEDKLLGRKSIIVTDHKSLEYFETQPSLSSRQTRWWEYLSHFNFTIQHVDGTTNRVADCLSHYYEMNGPGDKHPDHEFVSTDAWLNPDGELLPVSRYVEVCAATARRSRCLAKKLEQRVLESDQMNEQPRELTAQPVASENMPPDLLPLAIESGVDGESLRACVE